MARNKMQVFVDSVGNTYIEATPKGKNGFQISMSDEVMDAFLKEYPEGGHTLEFSGKGAEVYIVGTIQVIPKHKFAKWRKEEFDRARSLGAARAKAK